MLRISILFLLCVAPIIINHAQVKEEPIAINPIIGDTLTLDERDYYRLLPKIEGFQWAVFFLNPDSSLIVKVCYLKDNKMKDTVITRYRSLDNLRNYLSEVSNGEGAEVTAELKNGKEVSGNLLGVQGSDLMIYHPEGKITQGFDIEYVSKINKDEIEKLTIPGKSNILPGMGIGLLAGAALGAIVGYVIYGQKRD